MPTPEPANPTQGSEKNWGVGAKHKCVVNPVHTQHMCCVGARGLGFELTRAFFPNILF